MGDDVDFVVGADAPDQQEDDAPPGGSGRYRALVLLGVLVIAVAVITIVARQRSRTEHRAAPSSTPSLPDMRTLPTVALTPGPPVATNGPASCPGADACTITYDLPDAVLAAVHARFPHATLTAGRTRLATSAGRPSAVWERTVQFQDDKVTLVIVVGEPGDREGAVPVGARILIRPISDDQYLSVRAAADRGAALPGYAVLESLLDDNRLLAA